MTKFRQKEFIAPLAALGGIANAAMIGGTGISIIQGKKQQKEIEEQGRAAQEAAEKQQELIREQNRKLERIAEKAQSNPQAVGELKDVMGQRTYALINPKTVKNAKLMLGDGLKILNNHKDHLAGMAMTGVGVGTVNYAAGKYIQHDMKKEGLTKHMTEQKTYAIPTKSIMEGLSKGVKFAGKTAKNNWKSSLGWGVAIGGLPTVMQYQADKQQIKDQIGATQKAYANIGSILNAGKAALKSIPGKIKGTPKVAVESIRKIPTMAKGTWNSTKKGWNTFKSHPGQSILGGISNLSFGGGSKGVKNIANEMSQGQSEWTRKIASKMTRVDKQGNIQPTKVALAASIPVGLGIMHATWNAPEKAIKKATEAVDPGAYKYQNSKNQQI
jgi:hypothetical protein